MEVVLGDPVYIFSNEGKLALYDGDPFWDDPFDSRRDRHNMPSIDPWKLS